MKTYNSQEEFLSELEFDHEEALIINEQFKYGNPIGNYYSATELKILRFSEKVQRVLDRNNIVTVRDLEVMSMNKICKMRGMSQTCLDEIVKVLGFSFEWEM